MGFKNRYYEVIIIIYVIYRFKFFIFWFKAIINELNLRIFNFVENNTLFFDFNVFA